MEIFINIYDTSYRAVSIFYILFQFNLTIILYFSFLLHLLLLLIFHFTLNIDLKDQNFD